MLDGRNVNLRIAEKEDLPLFPEWFNSPEFAEYRPYVTSVYPSFACLRRLVKDLSRWAKR